MTVVELLAPIFLLIALGAGLQRLGLLEDGAITGINRLIYWVGLPAAVFHSLAHAEPSGATWGGLVAVFAAGTLVAVGLAWALARFIGVTGANQGTFVQAAFRGNLSFVGLPLFLTVPGVPTAAAVLALAPMLILYNALAVGALVMSRHTTGWRTVWPLLGQVGRNPIILASLAGAAWHAWGGPIIAPLARTLAALAQMALPLALLTIGAALMTVPLRGNRRHALAGAVFKTAVSPLIGYGLGWWAGLTPGELLTVMLGMACPTAAVSYTMVKQLGGDEGLAASTIVFSTLLAVPGLAIVLACFGP